MLVIEKRLIKELGLPYSKRLGIAVQSNRESELFKWFIASNFFAKPIREGSAIKTFQCFAKANCLSPAAIQRKGWNGLVALLDKGTYTRYDFSTATELLQIVKRLKEEYGGKISELYAKAKDSKDLEERLMSFKGIGPVTVNIFLRELRPVWLKANPGIAPLALMAAKNLGIRLENKNKKTASFVKLECALLKLAKDFCRKGKCMQCLFKKECKRKKRKN